MFVFGSIPFDSILPRNESSSNQIMGGTCYFNGCTNEEPISRPNPFPNPCLRWSCCCLIKSKTTKKYTHPKQHNTTDSMTMFNRKALFLLATTSSAMTTKTTAAFAVRHGTSLVQGRNTLLVNHRNVMIDNLRPHKRGQSRLFMGVFKDLFESPQFASQDEIQKAFQNPKVVVIDVRSPAEITTKVQAEQWINVPGSPFDCPMLSDEAECTKLLPDKTVPIILHCASGKRSQKATQILQDQGYQNVYNAGGMKDVESYLPIVDAK